jgi:NAD(P)-dependent dehydrogenase (short-subunit alcohol dehydrogenase family)
LDSERSIPICVAVVIGGTGVLGGAICHGLAEAGARIAVVGRSAERAAARVQALEADGATAIAVTADATVPAAMAAARRTIDDRLGPVDILVNAPGVNSSTPFLEISLDEWHALIDANLTSVFVACQVFSTAMIEAGRGGSIINISSASSGPPLSRVLTYSVAKAGLNNLTQYLAGELAPHRIRVNAVAPGFFPAEQNRKLLSTDRRRAIVEHTPAARLGEPDELVGTVVWLASQRASSFVTGAIVRVDGGFSAKTI